MHVVIPKVVHEWLTCKLTEERMTFQKNHKESKEKIEKVKNVENK